MQRPEPASGRRLSTATAVKEDILAILAKYGISNSEVKLWGTGTPLREFLWSEEMADASIFVMEHVDFKDTYKTR